MFYLEEKFKKLFNEETFELNDDLKKIYDNTKFSDNYINLLENILKKDIIKNYLIEKFIISRIKMISKKNLIFLKVNS